MKTEYKISYWFEATMHSYSQIFFSLNKFFAAIILLVTFFSPFIGLCGLLAVTLTNGLAYIFGFKQQDIREGIFGFNALLFGLALGYTFEPNAAFWVLFVIACFTLLVLIAVFSGTFAKIGLPFLSFPFLICFWMITLAGKELSHLAYANHFLPNMVQMPGPAKLLSLWVHSADNLELPSLLRTFFRTLSATFFQDSILGGMLISLGLFLFSRIAFSLAFMGFCVAFWSYHFFGANVLELSNNLVGSNYIFFAIAIGGFYLIPNKYSYGISILLIPVLMLMQIACDKLFSGLNLKTFTLAFSLLTVVFLYALHQRWLHQFLHLVTIQYYSAEKTVYKYLSALSRFKESHHKNIALPFWGDWFVSQGYDGKITHLGDWSKALDFVIVDENDKTYREPGILVGDYYCYNKPILAPADGYVYEITNHTEDNVIGEVDTDKNWGNTLILNHLDGLYTQLSHIKKDSFKVAVGDFVTKGTILATCGSSGRSPEPHVHFQVQHSPQIGAKTSAYPISCFIEKRNGKVSSLKLHAIPEENTHISNIETYPLLTDSFHFIPGKTLRFHKDSSNELIEWEVATDAWNRSFFYDKKSKSYAYFINDGNRFYFTDFEGSRGSDLFHFYLSCYAVLMGVYPEIEMEDQVPLIHFNYPVLIWVQDILAPFYLFTKAHFYAKVKEVNSILASGTMQLESHIEASFMGVKMKKYTYQITLGEKGIQELIWINGSRKETWVCIQ
jgi:urea transporter/murein DD-endopeptidase MepM/ murein hydrolase activator NlpD